METLTGEFDSMPARPDPAPARGAVNWDVFDNETTDGAEFIEERAPEPQASPLDMREGRNMVEGTGEMIPMVSLEDYTPTTGDVDRRLVWFRLADGRSMIPALESGRYRFADESGHRWVNEYQLAHFRNLPPETIQTDNYGVRWTLASNYESSMGIVLGVTRNLREGVISADMPPMPPSRGRNRKKLYRKRPMPDIKAEKYYAGKEYIA
jgi:hypothetical protein